MFIRKTKVFINVILSSIGTLSDERPDYSYVKDTPFSFWGIVSFIFSYRDF